MEKCDTLIVGARVIDGTGAPAVERDVAVRDGRIVAMEAPGGLSHWSAADVFDALGKVLAVMDGSRAEETRALAARVHLLQGAPPAPSPAGFSGALRAGTVLRLRYRDRAGVETEREVEPQGYVGRDGTWYLIAWCRTREAIRAFRGDRIVAAAPTGERPPRRRLTAADLDIPYGDLRPLLEP